MDGEILFLSLFMWVIKFDRVESYLLLLFNIDMDDLSTQLNGCDTESMADNSLIKHLIYADHSVISHKNPYSAGR